jgi:hypothetical protein
MTAFWDMEPCRSRTAIVLMMEAVRTTSEISFYFYETTRRLIPECCHLHVFNFVSELREMGFFML